MSAFPLWLAVGNTSSSKRPKGVVARDMVVPALVVRPLVMDPAIFHDERYFSYST
jgi:hypothetical protein